MSTATFFITLLAKHLCVRFMAKKKEAVVYPPTTPKRPERREDWRWPSPPPLPSLPAEDVGRVLKQIFNRLEAIEKRLENIEKMLMQGQQAP